MIRWLARLIGAGIGAFGGLVALQLMRLRRMEFLPGHPGFFVNHVVGTATPSLPALRMVVLGDSTTAGVGVERVEDSLPHLVADRIARSERRAVHVVSYGWSGARAADLVGDQLPRALRPLRASSSEPFLPGADVVIIVIGANDATHNTSPTRYRAALRAALEQVRAAAPAASVVLAGIPTFRGALRSVEPLMLIADVYARLLRPISRGEASRVGAAFADLAREVPRRRRPGVDLLARDRFHPSRAGYEIWADVIAEAHAPRRAAPPGDHPVLEDVGRPSAAAT